MIQPPADWQLPVGVSHGLWDYLYDADLARNYDAGLAHSPLARVDVAFADWIFRPPGRLLDLGCGTGRLSIPFAQKDFSVLSIDLSEKMLEVARTKATAAGANLAFVRANIVELDFLCGDSFDYAACLFSTLGMVTGAANRRQVVAHVFRLLRPGGKFIVHVHNYWSNLWGPHGRRWLLQNLAAAAFGSAAAGDKVMPVHQGVAGLTLHLFTRRELVNLLADTGFRQVEIIELGLAPDGRLPKPWWFGSLRADGYLAAVAKPR